MCGVLQPMATTTIQTQHAGSFDVNYVMVVRLFKAPNLRDAA